MKRLTIFVIILVGFTAYCLAQYRSRGQPLKIIQLSDPNLTGRLSFEQALAKRRSVRQFTSQPLSLAQIGQLAWAGQGITDKQRGLRTAPSAGAVYPIDLYFATRDGLLVYRPREHSLEQTFDQDIRSRLAAVASVQETVARAGCGIIVAGSVRKLTAQFRNQARRYMLLEAGHIAQNIQLQAVCLGLGSVPIGGFNIRNVSRVCKLPKDLEPIYVICVGHPVGQAATKTGEEQKSTTARRAVLIVARQNFQDEELFETKRILDEAAVQTVIASTRIGFLRGMLGRRAEATILVNDIVVDDYDAIIFVGGSGAVEYFDNPVALNIARQAADKRKILAAICIAPTVLANAGVLRGVRATSFASERDRLQRAGARYTGIPVERDGLIITANDPRVARQFGQAIADALQESAKLKPR